MKESPLHIVKYKGKRPDHQDKFENGLIFFLALPLMIIAFFLLYGIPPARYFCLIWVMLTLFGLEIEYYPIWRVIALARERYHLNKFTTHKRLLYSAFRTRVKTGRVERFEVEAKYVNN